MTIASAPISPQTQAMLKALQDAVAKTLETKRKLGQYAVTWQNGRPVQQGPDAPDAAGQCPHPSRLPHPEADAVPRD